MSAPLYSPALLVSVRGCRLFRELDDRELQEMLSACSLLHHHQGERVWREGDSTGTFQQVVRGLVELRRSACNAEVTSLAFFGPTECPSVPIGDPDQRHAADAVVVSADAIILAVHGGSLLERARRDPRVGLALHRALADQLHLLQGKIDVMAGGTVPRRIALFLLGLAERFGDELESGETVIPFGLSRQQVAAYVNARQETVIRALSVWRRDGVLTLNRDSIVLSSVDSLRAAVAV